MGPLHVDKFAEQQAVEILGADADYWAAVTKLTARWPAAVELFKKLETELTAPRCREDAGVGMSEENNGPTPTQIRPVEAIPSAELLLEVGRAEMEVGALQEQTGLWLVRLGQLRMRLWAEAARHLAAEAKAMAARESREGGKAMITPPLSDLDTAKVIVDGLDALDARGLFDKRDLTPLMVARHGAERFRAQGEYLLADQFLRIVAMLEGALPRELAPPKPGPER